MHVKELERIEKDVKAENIRHTLNKVYSAYRIALSMEIVLNVLYLFDKFYRENDRTFDEFFDVINAIKESLRYFEKDEKINICYNIYFIFEKHVTQCFIPVFEVLNFFVIKNIRKLNVNNENELKFFFF